ncbi:MAG: bifunctional riboflavin kinase/FMN adenylyltransferase, partial [Chloroflexi bacterium]|nr:bifunctional riboflavin kinase/FMN adenylyltransferase [Chloroflexota bacterium]
MTVGTFDGVHVGHRKLLKKVIELSKRMDLHEGGASVAIVFRQQPRALLQPERPVKYIQRLEDRLAMLAETGLDVIVPVDFDPALRELTPRQFAGELLDRLQMRHLVLGPGAAIGKDRSGDAAVLTSLGREMGFELHTVEPILHRGQVVSSSAVRSALAEGRLDEVEAMLGRRFAINGTVESGQRRGKQLGFPTANLSVEPHSALPADGIYATWAWTPGSTAGNKAVDRKHPAATSIGLRPTFGAGDRTLEAHLIGYRGDLYGTPLELEFVARLRDELKFDDVAA